MRRTALWCGAGAAAILLTAAAVVALAVYRPLLVRPWLERALAPRGGTATVGDLKVSFRPPSLGVSDLAIAGPPPDGDSLRISLLRFELIPGRLVHGGPWLRRVEIRGLAFERRRPRESKGAPDLTPLTRLFDMEDLSLSDARLRVALPQGDLSIDGVRLRLVPGKEGVRDFSGYGEATFRRNGSPVGAGTVSARGKVTTAPAIDGDLEVSSAHVAFPVFSGDVSGRATVRVTRKRIEAGEVGLTVTQGRWTPGSQAPENLAPIHLTGSAASTLSGLEPRLTVGGLDIGGLLFAQGELKGPKPEELSGTLNGEIPRVERMKPLLASLLPRNLAGMELSGALRYRADLSYRRKESGLALELHPRDLQFSWTDIGLSCRLGGAVRAEGPLRGWLRGRAAMTGRLQGSGEFERSPFALRKFRFDVPFRGDIAAPTLPGWMLSAGAGDALYKGTPLPVGTLELRGTGRAADRSFLLEDVEIRSGTLGRLAGEVAFRAGAIGGRLGGAGLPADNLLSLARAVTGEEWKGWTSTGSTDVSVRLDPAEGAQRVAATATLGRVGFGSPAGDVMSQNLAGRLDLEAYLSREPRIKADLSLHGGELLWGTVYVDFAKDPLELHAGGTRGGVGEYKDLSLEGGFAGFGRLRIEGKARKTEGGWRHQGRLVVRDANLGPIFRTFLRDPLAASSPDLAGLETGGTAGIDLSFAGVGNAADLDGTLRLRSVEVRRGADPPMLSGLDIDLPVSYSLGAANPGRSRPSDAAKWGRVRLANLRFSGQELGPLDVPAVLVPNNLYLGGTIEASPFGSRLSLRQLQVADPLGPGFRIRLTAQLEGLDLGRIAGKTPLLEGHIGGRLDPVTIDRERLTAAGELAGDLFGGHLSVRRVGMDRPFSPGREVGADVGIDRIDLERLSAALGVGRITGRISGSMEGLRVAYGQPVAFRLRMESTPVKGVAQSVSLKAVNSIALVSSGSALSGLGVSLMTKFFREFPYEKIGFESTLENDVFTVRGLIHDDGVEYLVKRRLFSGINVVNANPNNRIGFSDMLDRAKRVTEERSH